MKPQIDMIGIVTSNFQEMKEFYTSTLGFSVTLELEQFVEFSHEGVRFAISTSSVMAETTKQDSYNNQKSGHSFELAFRVNSPNDVDTEYQTLITKGATPIASPEDKPWGQRTAFFADPDGNIHEVFADL